MSIPLTRDAPPPTPNTKPSALWNANVTSPAAATTSSPVKTALKLSRPPVPARTPLPSATIVPLTFPAPSVTRSVNGRVVSLTPGGRPGTAPSSGLKRRSGKVWLKTGTSSVRVSKTPLPSASKKRPRMGVVPMGCEGATHEIVAGFDSAAAGAGALARTVSVPTTAPA